MSKKSNISTALWFIPLLAVLLAVLFLFVFWVGRIVLHKSTGSASRRPAVQENVDISARVADVPAPIIPPTTPEVAEEIPVPQEVIDMNEELEQTTDAVQTAPEVCPATTMAVKIKKPQRKISYTPYQKGLLQCKKNQVFPCAWSDKTNSAIKQYWLMSAEGPITRGIYDTDGNLKSETVASVNGTVTSHLEQNMMWYFEAGMLVKIRTSPYDNCNFHDWFFINEKGQQDVCQCAYTTKDCCARSPFQTGMSRNYCMLFPLDKDFCK